jgi:hypothetical protein
MFAAARAFFLGFVGMVVLGGESIQDSKFKIQDQIQSQIQEIKSTLRPIS